MTRGSCWSEGFPSNGRRPWPKPDRTIGSPPYLIKSDGEEDSWKNTTIAVRSNRDRDTRAAIVTPSGRNHLHDLQKGILEDRNHDRGPIVASIEANLRKKLPQIRELRCRTRESLPGRCNRLPRPHQLATIFGPIFLFKKHVFPFFFLQLLIDS